MRKLAHDTRLTRKHAVNPEVFYDHHVGDRVMTRDGFPGVVTAVLDGPGPGYEVYEVVLDNNVGGGQYRGGDVWSEPTRVAALDGEPGELEHVEAGVEHDASADYPELGTILTDRPPIENIRVYASRRTARHYFHVVQTTDGLQHSAPFPTFEDAEADAKATYEHGHHMDIRGDVVPNLPDDAIDSLEKQGHEYQKGLFWLHNNRYGAIFSSDPGAHEAAFVAADTTGEGEEPVEDELEAGEEAGGNPPTAGADQPDTCGFCGSTDFDEFQDTGRGTRARCAQCDGTMVKPYGGIQWQVEFPNSSQNNPSRRSDSRSVINDPRSVHSSWHLAVDQESCPHDQGFNLHGQCKRCGHIPPTEDDEPCDNPWCVANEPEHTKGEHIDPPHLDPGHPDYHSAERNIQDAIGGHPDAWLFEHKDTGPSKYSVLNAAATAEAGYPIFTGLDVPEIGAGFEFTATWADVRRKGVRLRKEGRVRVLVATNDGAAGEVDGDTALYETQYVYVPGTRKVGYWHCGCKWNAWANIERSPAYKRFQHRPCSHNLALRYAVMSKGAHGREVHPDTERLPGQHQRSPVTVQYQLPTERAPGKDINRRSVPPGNVRRHWHEKSRVRVKGSLQTVDLPPAYEWGRLALAAGTSPPEVLAALRSAGLTHEAARDVLAYGTASWSACSVLGAGEPAFLVDVDPQTRTATLYDGRQLDVGLVKYATHPFGEEDDEWRHHHAQMPYQDIGDEDVPDSQDESGGTDAAGGPGAMQSTSSYDSASFSGTKPTSDPYQSNTPHVTSENPTSTGWGTSADPANWQLNIANPSNLTNWNASLHTGQTSENGGGGPGGAGDSQPPDGEVTHAGVALKAGDTGRVLMIQRSNHDPDDPAAGTWEFPGGKLEDGDQTSLHGGIREWEEEVGQAFPTGGHLTHVHRNKNYVLHVVHIPEESAVGFGDGRSTTNPDDPDGDDHEQSAWWEIKHAKDNPALRREVKKTPWDELKKAAANNVTSVTSVRGDGGSTTYKPSTAVDITAALEHPHEKVTDPDWKTGYAHAIDDEPYQLPHYPEGDAGYLQATRYAQGYQEGREAQGQKWGARYVSPSEVAGRCHNCGAVDEGVGTPPYTHLCNNCMYTQINAQTGGWGAGGLDWHYPQERSLSLGHGEHFDLQVPEYFPGHEHWHTQSTLNDHPEPALPSTDGASDEAEDLDAAPEGQSSVDPSELETDRQMPWGFPEADSNPQDSPQPVDEPGPDTPLLSTPMRTHVVAGQAPDAILAEFWKTAGGAALVADSSGADHGPSDPAKGEYSDADIAAAARAVLAKTGAKDFSFAEQRELIDEGLVARARARNFDELDLEGTHYALLGEGVEDDEDLWL